MKNTFTCILIMGVAGSGKTTIPSYPKDFKYCIGISASKCKSLIVK